MATVSDELVERVAKAIRDNFKGDGGFKHAARAAIAALSTPEFVLPLAEEMLRDARFVEVIHEHFAEAVERQAAALQKEKP